MIEEAMSNSQLRETILNELYLRLKNAEPGTKEYTDLQDAIDHLERNSQKALEIENERLNAYTRNENDAEKNRIEAARVEVERKKVRSGWWQMILSVISGLGFGVLSFGNALFQPNKTFLDSGKEMIRQIRSFHGR